jgi:hypothetical protein
VLKAQQEKEAMKHHLFGYEIGSFAVRYFGIPIHFRKLDEARKWVGKLLSYGDLLVLINSFLMSLPMFMISLL